MECKCSLANYSVVYEETQSNRVSDFRDFLCVFFLFFFFFVSIGNPFLLLLNTFLIRNPKEHAI